LERRVHGADVFRQSMAFQIRPQRRRQDPSSNPDRVLREIHLFPQTCFDLKHALGAGWWRDRVDCDRIVMRTESKGATNTLIEPGGIPRQVEVNDD
jgi:hypothetical protein